MLTRNTLMLSSVVLKHVYSCIHGGWNMQILTTTKCESGMRGGGSSGGAPKHEALSSNPSATWVSLYIQSSPLSSSSTLPWVTFLFLLDLKILSHVLSYFYFFHLFPMKQLRSLNVTDISLINRLSYWKKFVTLL
jgi:hypothetical protein